MAINLKREGIALNAEERNKRNENLTIIEQELEKIGSASALAELAKLAADDAKVKTENVQQQVNALTVSGDSSPQAAQASIGADGTDYDGNLKARLDAEHNTVTAQLAETGGRIDNIIATAGDGSVPTELTDIRVIDGKTYQTAGEAVRAIANGEAIMDEAITADKIGFISKTTGKNLFDKTNVILNKMFAENLPTLVTLNGYYATDRFIMLEGNETYTIRYVRQWYLMELDGVTVFQKENTADNVAVKTITTPNRKMLLKISGSLSNLDSTQIEKGDQFTFLEPHFQNLSIEDLELTDKQMLSTKKAASKLKVVKSGESFNLIGSFNALDEIVIKTSRNGSANGTFNFLETVIGETKIHDTRDDITPIRTFYTVGANHGYAVLQITKSGFGKVDLGSKWTDGVRTFTLVKVSGSILQFAPEYTVDTAGIVKATSPTPTAALTHVSGASNTADVSITGFTINQLYPSVNKVSVKYVLDQKEVVTDGIFYGDDLQIQEHYTVIDYKALIDYAQANIGKSYVEGNVDGVIKVSNIFNFSDGLKCTTSHGFKVLKKVSVTTCGFLQSTPLLSVSGHTRKRFMPNVKVKSGFDFMAGVNLDTFATSLLFQKADLINPEVPPSHYTDWIYGSGDVKKYGFTMGYIVDKTNSKNADRLNGQNSLWDMRDTKKSYPIALDYKTFESGEYKSFMGFRNYLSPSETGDAVTANVVKDKKDTYLYTHLNNTEQVFSKRFDEHTGKQINLLQSNGITKLNEIVDSEGIVLKTVNGSGSGVFKIN